MMTSQKRRFILKMAKAKNARAFGVRWSVLLSVCSCFSPHRETAHAKSGDLMPCSATNPARKSSGNLLASRSFVRAFSIVIISSHTISLKNSLFFVKPSISLYKNFLSQYNFAVGPPSYMVLSTSTYGGS
jgi:hypothetical protein